MNKQQLVDAVGERLGDRRTAAAAVEAVLDTVTGALADGERVALFGFGVFERVDRAARTARNPATGGTVEVPATSVPRFRPGQGLKDAVNGRSSGTGTSARTSAAPGASTGSDRPSDATAKTRTDTTPKSDGKKKSDGGTKSKAKGKADAKGGPDGGKKCKKGKSKQQRA